METAIAGKFTGIADERLLNDFKDSLGDALCQSEAAALAVLASSIRKKMDEENSECVAKQQPPMYHEQLVWFWHDLEMLAVDSIARNDGAVVHWIGVAAKQMNPLLS